MASRSQGLDGIEDREEEEERKEKESEGDGGLDGTADAVAVAVIWSSKTGSKCYGAGEPENGCNGEENQRGKLVEESRIVERREADVGEDQERPDGVEEHEVDLTGR